MHDEDRRQGLTGEVKQYPDLSGTDQDQKDEVDIAINGNKGPTIRFRIGVLAVINGIILLVGFTFSLLKADVDDLKVEGKSTAAHIHTVIEELSAVKTGQDYLREEIRFLRDELAASDNLRAKKDKQREAEIK
jgi:hypothetical protein